MLKLKVKQQKGIFDALIQFSLFKHKLISKTTKTLKHLTELVECSI